MAERRPIGLDAGWSFMERGIHKLKRILENEHEEQFTASALHEPVHVSFFFSFRRIDSMWRRKEKNKEGAAMATLSSAPLCCLSRPFSFVCSPAVAAGEIRRSRRAAMSSLLRELEREEKRERSETGIKERERRRRRAKRWSRRRAKRLRKKTFVSFLSLSSSASAHLCSASAQTASVSRPHRRVAGLGWRRGRG